ncbi:KamA family radical SAM protein [Fodinisporobacter ferrooxydans]|uniref:KamA family radical SAM protein n=1 Tax=Fodinisporobacter ferrooxydans TaxID=2901836 RepID=A0ABY4CNW5_9BACL|nr:KamA family radical SAM protein [Alicyclobacillaceae bacterium MYW30-H2]
MKMTKYITNINHILDIPEQERLMLKEVTEKYAFRVNEYYLQLINWQDPDDPIKKLIIPSINELNEYGDWDASDEESNYVAPGCQHKYQTTALLLVSEVCGAYCRYCFRKRLFQEDVTETVLDCKEGLAYIHEHPEINNVLLTGGDPLLLSTARIRNLIQSLRQMDHVRIIRFGSKLPVFDPMRIYNDKELLETFQEYSQLDRRIYVVTHVSHPREITNEALQCFDALQKAGVIMVNQTPILRGINDDADVLAELLNRLAFAGVTPYYFFVNRPVVGNSEFVLPLKKIYRLVEQAKAETSGLGKRVRLVLSHSSGKIEILAIEDDTAYLKYHQARNGQYGKFMVLPCPDDATWFDDLTDYGQY